MNNINNKHRCHFLTLDGWRAISILLVIMCHGISRWKESLTFLDPKQIYLLNIAGAHGVSIFFGISGFLITSRILFEIKIFGSFNLKDFYYKRFFRIMPPFLFYLGTTYCLNLFFNFAPNTSEFLKSLFFIIIYWGDAGSWYTGHIWSLCVEEHFYIILSTLFIFLTRKNLIHFFVGYFIIITAWNYFSFHHKANPDVENLRTLLKVYSSMSFIIIGTLLAFFYEHPIFEKIISKIQELNLISVIVISLFPLLYFEYPMKQYLLPIFLPCTVVLTCKKPIGMAQKFLEFGLLKYIGRISYSLYLWQQLFLPKMGHEFLPGLHTNGNIIFDLIGLFTIASLSFYFVEQPLIKFGRSLIKHRF